MSRLAVAMVAAVVVLVSLRASAVAQIERYAVVIGSNVGLPDEVELRYAESDALKIYDLLVDAGGFSPADSLLLRGPQPDAVRDALLAMNDRIRQRSAAARSRSMLLVYYSGHGDAQSLHMGRESLRLRQLEQLVSSSPAAFRVLILDSCRSGAATRVKGGRRAPPMELKLERRLSGEGLVVLTASSANEDAQESDRLKGSFFTHYLVSGLLGAADANRDGVVGLAEAYEHAYQHTLRASSRTEVGPQHPTFRFDLRGKGDIPLTRLGGGRRAVVRLPTGRSYLLFRGDADGPVIAEIGARDAQRVLSVPPGRYFVRARASDYLLEGMVSLLGGQAQGIPDDALSRTEYARLVRKGGAGPPAVHGPLIGIVGRSGLFGDQNSCFGPRLGYGVDSRYLSMSLTLNACTEGTDGTSWAGATRERTALLRLSRAWDLPGVTLDIGIASGAAWLRQSFTSFTGVEAPPRASVAMVLGPGLRLIRDLPMGMYLDAEVGAHTYFARFLERAEPDSVTIYHDEVGARFALQVALGLGKRW